MTRQTTFSFSSIEAKGTQREIDPMQRVYSVGVGPKAGLKESVSIYQDYTQDHNKKINISITAFTRKPGALIKRIFCLLEMARERIERIGSVGNNRPFL